MDESDRQIQVRPTRLRVGTSSRRRRAAGLLAAGLFSLVAAMEAAAAAPAPQPMVVAGMAPGQESSANSGEVEKGATMQGATMQGATMQSDGAPDATRPDGTSQVDGSHAAASEGQAGMPADVAEVASTGLFGGWFRADRLALFVWLMLIGGAMLLAIILAKSGMPIRIRRLPALDAIEEAVGRATEMGRSVLFVPGIQDMNDIQTVAGITVLGPVAKTAAEFDARLEVPTSRSLVMVAARETVQAAHYAAERPETYSDANITYLTDEQFAYVGAVAGKMVRERPAACFYMGAFYAESLLFAETGNSIGAIQIAGTAEPSQLPFFVAACDYTLIGEEFFAASAYLSGEREQLGSILGQDIGKAMAILAIVGGSAYATVVALVDAFSATGG